MSVNRFAETSPDSSPDYSAIGVDTNSKTLLSQYFKDSIVGEPLKTTGDGDCLFNAASILLVGNESMCLELCYKTVLMMIKEETSILGHEKKADLWWLSPTYKDAILECARVGAYSCVWTMMALSLVIRRPIRSVWPAVFGEKHLTFCTLNTVFNVIPDCDPITIMWSTMSKVTNKKSKKALKLDHFVAIYSYYCNSLQSSKCESVVMSEGNAVCSSVKQEVKTPPTTSEPAVPGVKATSVSCCDWEDQSGICVSPIKEEPQTPDTLPDLSNASQKKDKPKKSTTKRKLEESNVAEQNPSTSTPTVNTDEDWQTSKRRKKSNDCSMSSMLEVSNRYQSLSVMESEEELNFVSDPDAYTENLHKENSRKKKVKRKRTKISSSEDLNMLKNESTPRRKKVKSKGAKIPSRQDLSSSESEEENFVSDPDTYAQNLNIAKSGKKKVKSKRAKDSNRLDQDWTSCESEEDTFLSELDRVPSGSFFVRAKV